MDTCHHSTRNALNIRRSNCFSGCLLGLEALSWSAKSGRRSQSIFYFVGTSFGCNIIFGNWVYIGYREAGGPRSWFLENSPEVHEIFFEFKEYIALFTLPLALGTMFTIWTYRERLREDKSLRTTVALLLIVKWAIFILTFILGAAITKLRSV